MTPMRLILVSEHYAPSNGATAQLMSDLSNGLANRGWEIIILTATTADLQEERDSPSSIVRLGAKLRNADDDKSVGSKTFAGLQFLLSTFIWTIKKSKAGDIMLIASNPPFIGVIGPVLKLVKKLPYIFLFQDLFPRSAVLSGVLPAKGLTTQAWANLMKWVCNHSDGIVVPSRSIARRLQRENSKVLPIKVIENWAIEKAYGRPRAINKFAIKQGFQNLFTIQYSGNFGRLHDIETLVQSAANLQDLPTILFLFIGGGFKQPAIERAGLKNLMLLPYQPRSQLPETLAACDLACISLISGAEDTMAPCKLYGILASGRGVVLIANPDCELAHLIQQERIGIVVSPGDSQHLAQQLKALSDAPHEVAAMGKRAKRLYDEHFGFERSLLQYDQLLRSIR